jgi:hypothetical protein
MTAVSAFLSSLRSPMTVEANTVLPHPGMPHSHKWALAVLLNDTYRSLSRNQRPVFGCRSFDALTKLIEASGGLSHALTRASSLLSANCRVVRTNSSTTVLCQLDWHIYRRMSMRSPCSAILHCFTSSTGIWLKSSLAYAAATAAA